MLAQQGLVECHDGHGRSWVSLAGAAAHQLPVDARRLVIFSQHHTQPAPLGYAFTQGDVGAASSHIGRDSDGSGLPGCGHHGCLVGVLARIEYNMRESTAIQHTTEPLGSFDRTGADEHWLPEALPLLHEIGDRFPLRGLVGTQPGRQI